MNKGHTVSETGSRTIPFGSFLFGIFLSLPPIPSLAADCTWESVAARYRVNPQILFSIARKESGLNPLAINRNANGTLDFGLMQVNSRWLPLLGTWGIRQQDLMDSCINLHVGAYILASEMARRGNTWEAVGSYHSPTPWRQNKYAIGVVDDLRRRGVVK